MTKPKTIRVQLTTWEFTALERALELAVDKNIVHPYSAAELHDKLNAAWLKVFPSR